MLCYTIADEMACFREILTIDVKNKGCLSWLDLFAVHCLACEYRVQVLASYGWPRQSVFDDVSGVVFVLFIYKDSVH